MRAGHYLLAVLLFASSGLATGEDAMQPSLQELKHKHEARLLALPGVVSVGIGQDNNGRPAIIIGLDKPRAQTETEIHNTLGDTPVIVQVVGTIKPLKP